MASKPIDKDYLKSTLLSFDGSVLERKYARKTDIAEQHTHSNKETLDKFSEFSDGTLLFNGNEISSEWEDIGNKPFESLDNNTLGVENGVLKVVNVQETMQVSELPAPTVDTLDKIYQYIGTTTSDYTNGLFYRCEEVLDSNCDVTGYTWNELSLQTEEEINRYVLKEELENHAMSVSHITSGERTAWNNKAESDDIPTKVSDLQDDVNLSDIHRHANKEDILDKLSANSNGQLLFNNELVSSGIEISSDPNNIIENKPDGICASVDLSDYAKTNDVITSSATRTESSVDSAISNTHNHTNKSDVLDKLGTNADGKLTFDNTVVGTSTEISQDADNVISLGSDGGVYYRPDHTHSNKDYLDKIGEDNGEFTYNGNRISSDIEISTRANNALQRESDGSYYVDGTTSSTTQIQISAETDNNISLNADGLYVPKPKISTESGNALVENNGLYVPQNTVEISSEADNQIESKSDGIYVAKSPVQTVNNQTPDSNRNITLTLDNVEDGTTRKIPQFESENLSETYSGSDKVVSSQYLNQQFANKSDILDKLGKNASGSLTFDGTDVASASVNISQNAENIIEQADDGIYATVDLSPYATTTDIEADYLTKESAQQTYMKSETYVDENGEILGEKIKPQSISYSDLDNIGELDGVNIEQKLLQHLANTQIHNIGSLNSILINASEWDKGTLTNFIIESDGTMGLAHATENPISYVLDTATFVSKIYDVGSEMPFTTLNFDAVYNPYLSNISLHVRSGSTDTYSSSTWTDWVDVTQTLNLVGVNARYVQLKIEGNTVNEYKNIKFNYVQIYYGQDSDVELANARVGVNGTNYGSLKNRLDYIEELNPGKSAYEFAVDNGFVGTETEWLESLKGSDGDKGDNGTTPHIDETTKNWFIGNTDTGILAQGTNGKDGKSISTITKDDSNNLIVTFTDGSTQNIGKLSVDIQGDFLTSDGFGNLRYYNGHFQYYDKGMSVWVDTTATPSNVLVVNMIPKEMNKMFGIYDTVLHVNKLKFEEPSDTIIKNSAGDDEVVCVVESVIIRRKLGSVPTSEKDGDLVIKVERKDFGRYKDTWFVDTGVTPNVGDVYYYRAFPVSSTGLINNSTYNQVSVLCKEYELYGFRINQNESNPDAMITYLADNAGYEPAHMDFSKDIFNYGSWDTAFFIRNIKPCMLKKDGTVDYELDPNDFSKRKDNELDSDISNESYEGNAMVGIPTAYVKFVKIDDNTAEYYISNKKIDDDYNCFAHLDANGNVMPYTYMPIYNSSLINNCYRSLSGKAAEGHNNGDTEIQYINNNNIDGSNIWYGEVFSDRQLLNLLIYLISKSTNVRAKFGIPVQSYINTGNTDKCGLFYGTTDGSKSVKIFGIENYYGLNFRRVAGCLFSSSYTKIKACYGQQDGSTSDGYDDINATGYITFPSGLGNYGYIKKCMFTKYGIIATTTGASSTTYYCSGVAEKGGSVSTLMAGIDAQYSYSYGGIFAGSIGYSFTTNFHNNTLSTNLSCKPLVHNS